MPIAGRAHTRERNRIAAFEVAQEKRNAVLTQGVKDALDAAARLDEEIKARREHAEHLGRQIDALRSDMAAGLGSVVGSVSAAMTKPLQGLEQRFSAQLEGQEKRNKERLDVLMALETKQRNQAVSELDARLKRLDQAQSQEASSRRLQEEGNRNILEELQTSLQGFRAYLKQFNAAIKTRNATIEARLGKLSSEVEVLRQKQLANAKENSRRLKTLLQVVNQENLKLRRGLEKLAGGGKSTPVVHVVQKGESLYGIARQYGVDLKALEQANPELSKPGAVVHPGTKVKLPK
jgi:LysM repeat protein